MHYAVAEVQCLHNTHRYTYCMHTHRALTTSKNYSFYLIKELLF